MLILAKRTVPGLIPEEEFPIGESYTINRNLARVAPLRLDAYDEAMPQLLPPTFLFRFSFPVWHLAEMPRDGKVLLGLPEECRLPEISALNGKVAPVEFRIAWNAEGL